MRLLYVCADRGIPLDGSKGASVHVRQTLQALVRRGVELSVLAARPGRPGAVPGRLLSAGAAARDGVNGPLAAELAALAASRDLAADAALPAGGVDAIYERYSLWSLTGAVLADRLGVPLLLEVNAPLVEEQARYRRLILSGVAAEIERYLARRADAVLCVSSVLRDRIAGLRGDSDDVHLFPNAVDIDRFRPAAGDGRGEAVSIIFTGSFKAWHGVHDLLEAFARLPPERARLILVGDGPEREPLERRARALGVAGRVLFTGPLSHEEIPALLAAADVAAAPYPALEGFYFSPLKVVEYLAAGLPVVATRCGDLDRWLRDGEAALRVRPGDRDGLARALRRLVDDPLLRRRLGAAGRRIAEEHLSLDGAAGRLLDLLGAACGGSRREVAS